MSTIRYDVADAIGTITIDRPQKRGAMTYDMLFEFVETVRRAGADGDARVLVLTGTEGSFCAGTDLADLATVPGAERGVRGHADERDVWWPLIQCPKPVIAAIDGAAVGMGVEFATHCDIRLASTRSRFGWVFVHRGLVPDTGAGTWLLPRLVGLPTALELLYSGRLIDADEALRLGFVREVLQPDEVLPRAYEVARSYLAGSPFAMGRMKELVYRGLERDVGDHMAAHVETLKACFASDDHAEGTAAFLERREPRFTGR